MPLCDAYRLDWQQIVLNLRSAGISCASISRQVGCDEAVVQRLARGDTQETLFSISAGLLDLHERICTPKHDLAALTKRAAYLSKEQRAA